MDAEVSVPNETGGGQSKMEAKRVQMMVSCTRVTEYPSRKASQPQPGTRRPRSRARSPLPDPPFKTKHP